MSEHFADRLWAACDAAGAPVCVGLDPVLRRLPVAVRGGGAVAAAEAFCLGVVEAVAGVAPCVKPQLACFERYGAAGYAAYERVVVAAKAAGLLVVADAKRGDIGVSSEHYAVGLLTGDAGADAVTVNGYLGEDGVRPFVDVAAAEGAGVFVLVRTSNPGGDAVQSARLADGRSVAEAMADRVAGWGAECEGACGYSAVGAVVGATKREDAEALRARMPRQVFLLPGYGAQGAGAEDVRAAFDADGRGALVTASRSVLYPGGDGDWQANVRGAAERLRDEVAGVLG